MTREQAQEAFRQNLREFPSLLEQTDRAIDLYVALGMLKLDEADIDEWHGKVFKIRKFMRNFHLESYSPGQFEGALAIAGLKVVEE